MINFNNTKEANVIADNKVVFCGLTYLVTDKEAEQLKSILDGMVSSRSCNIIIYTTLFSFCITAIS